MGSQVNTGEGAEAGVVTAYVMGRKVGGRPCSWSIASRASAGFVLSQIVVTLGTLFPSGVAYKRVPVVSSLDNAVYWYFSINNDIT